MEYGKIGIVETRLRNPLFQKVGWAIPTSRESTPQRSPRTQRINNIMFKTLVFFVCFVVQQNIFPDHGEKTFDLKD